MVSVANPIYDIVFKYLMEDERIARIILSALLKKNIVKVEMRPHEYASDKDSKLSIYRIDFAATVKEADTSEHLMLIELQKTWLETETLRFRRYLGVQYEDERNMGTQSTALPMVAVYLLGHKVGDIDVPVVYVNHSAVDYNERPVTKGIPDPLVESLTHDSIIVQIPLLHGQINNRLDKVLSIFDQTRTEGSTQQILNLDDSNYQDDADMQHILHRMEKAGADKKVRQEMNVEDEYYSVIEKRDTEILMRDKQLAEQKAQLTEQKAQLEQKDAQLEQKDAQLEQKDAQLSTSVQLLYKSGLSIEAIAEQLGMTTDDVRHLVQ